MKMIKLMLVLLLVGTLLWIGCANPQSTSKQESANTANSQNDNTSSGST